MNIDFKNIADNIDSIIVAVDSGGKIIYANKLFYSVFGTDNPRAVSEFFNENTIHIKETTYKITKTDYGTYSVYCATDRNMEKVYSDFISTVSHELRTPLTSIRGFADTMLLSFDKLNQAQIQKFLSIIKEQSNRLINLIENLLSISKMQSEHDNLVYKSLNVKFQIEQLFYIINSKYPEIHFELKADNNLQPILADETKFQQIILNLLDNAAKYSYDNGFVTVKLANASDFISIKVEDNGIGIEPENLGKIFERFARIENHLTRKTQGSGLGLFIIKNLVEKMGGKILVTSSIVLPNSGSVFEVLLPCASYTNQSIKALEDQ
jgi:signal transduction histidine kinase